MRKQVKYQDDGRVVAPMDVPGMPREGEGAFGLSQRERRAAAWGLPRPLRALASTDW